MRRFTSFILSAAGLYLLLSVGAGVARAEEEGHHGGAVVEGAEEAAHKAEHEGLEPEKEPEIDGKKLGFQLFNFAALAFLLYYFGRKPVKQALSARHEQLKTDLAAAAQARAEAEARLVKQEKRLAALESEIAGIRAGIKQEAEMEKARLIEMAEERAKRIKEETKFLLDQQVKEAEATLRRDAARHAVEMAEAIVKRSLNTGDQQRMIDTFVGEIASPTNRSAS